MNRKQTRQALRITVLLLLIGFAIQGIFVVNDYIGYASFAGEAGNIYELVIKHHVPTDQWAGQFGVAVRFDGYFFQQSETLGPSEIETENLLFDCLEPDIEHEIYASVYDDFDLSGVTPATAAEVNAFYGLDPGSIDSAGNTLVSNITFQLGALSVTAPGTYTYTANYGTLQAFSTAAIKDAQGRIGFVIVIASNLTAGFNNEVSNYQAILPVYTNLSETTYYYFTDPNDLCPAGVGEEPNTCSVIGNVTSESGNPLDNVIVTISGIADLSDGAGAYNVTPPEGNHLIFGIREGYKTYVNNVSCVANSTTTHNIVMVLDVNETNPDIGPGLDPPGTGEGPGQDVGPGEDVGPGQSSGEGPGEIPPVPFVEEPKQIEGIDYIISLSEIKRKLRIDTFRQESLYVYSFKKSPVTLTFTLEAEENLSRLIVLDKNKMIIEPNGNDKVIITIYGRPPVGVYKGNLTIDGEINATIPVEIEILPKDQLPVEALLMNLETSEKEVLPGDLFKFKADLRNLLIDRPYPVGLLFTIQPLEGQGTVWSYETNVFLKTAFSLIRTVDLPKDLEPGDYILRANANYLDIGSSTSTIFTVEVPFWQKSVLGLKNWFWGLIIGALIALGIIGFLVWRNIQGKKKYHLKVELAELPKPGPRNIYVGKIAETDHKTYMNLENFKTHTIVAGSTGGGKSVSAQVIVEEALDKGVAVICFDPTAQWSGMLRQCKDKTMLSLYPFFGMKRTEAKAFNGNIRMITNARELIDIRKYAKPGEIQVFACHKLDPKDMDIVVANAIREIFHSNFQESKPLKIMFVFDEVHRLLPKFGGSGDGFLQIERACREFRKWGLGVMLISQVLSDFVGTIKANINTEVQMRTRDEGDLERIRVKYGEDVLRSLVKATVGSGLVENPAYNRGKPYFIAFKPLKHSVERLPDEEIEEYNKYNDMVDDMEYSLQQLEDEGVDVFDLKLELKLALDKVKQGNFNMVKIYLEGLMPRVEKQWTKMGKKPKAFERKLVDMAALQEELTKAKKERDEYVADQEKNKPDEEEKKKEWAWADDAPPDRILNLKNDMIVLSLSSLYDEVTAMKDKHWEREVNAKENRLADWVEKATGLKKLTDNMRTTMDKDETVKILEKFRDGKELPEVKPEQLLWGGEDKTPPADGAAQPDNKKAAEPEKKEEPAAEEGKKEVPAQEEQMQEEVTAEASARDTAATPVVPEEPVEPTKEPIREEHPQEPMPKIDPLEELVAHDPTEYFRLENGIELKSVLELRDYLPKMDEEIFHNHVGEGYNHFAEWIRGVFHRDDLANNVANAHTKEEILAVMQG